MWQGVWTAVGVILGYLMCAFLGAMLGGIVAYFAGAAYGTLANVSNREGMYGYAVLFGMVPVGAMIGAVLGIIYEVRRLRRRRAAGLK